MKLKQKDFLIIFKKTNGYCFYCNSPKAIEVDHFFPNNLHKEWGLKNFTNNNSLDNLFLSCIECNRKKRDKHPEDFLGGNYITWEKWHRANFRVGLIDNKQYSI